MREALERQQMEFATAASLNSALHEQIWGEPATPIGSDTEEEDVALEHRRLGRSRHQVELGVGLMRIHSMNSLSWYCRLLLMLDRRRDLKQ